MLSNATGMKLMVNVHSFFGFFKDTMRQSSQGFLITISTLTSHSYFCRTSTGGESDISVKTLKQEVFVNNYFQFSLCFAKI